MDINFRVILFLCYLLVFLSNAQAVEEDLKYFSTNAEGNRARLSKLLCEASYTCIDLTTSIRDRFNRDGYVVLKNFFGATADEDVDDPQQQPSSLVSLLGKDWYEFSIQYWNLIFQVLHDKGHISQPHHVMNDEYVLGKLRDPGYKEIVHRNPGRYELSLNNHPSDDDTSSDRSMLYQDMPSLQPIIDKLEPVILSILKQHPKYPKETNTTTKKYNLLYSMLISAPGSRIQQFHFDTRHTNEQVHWPAHIINVFIPLINITTTDLGPTQLIPKSHIETRLLQNPQTRSEAKPLLSHVTPLMNVGDVLMFDFRILHRGTANTDLRQMNRPMLVLAFSIPSFHDTTNWPGPSIFE